MANTTRYDRYGRPAGYISPIEGRVEPYLTDKADTSTTYQCYYETGDDPRAIRRIKQVGTVIQICVAWAAWSDRATATYYPVNTYFEVDNDTGAVVYPTTPAPDPDAE